MNLEAWVAIAVAIFIFVYAGNKAANKDIDKEE